MKIATAELSTPGRAEWGGARPQAHPVPAPSDASGVRRRLGRGHSSLQKATCLFDITLAGTNVDFSTDTLGIGATIIANLHIANGRAADVHSQLSTTHLVVRKLKEPVPMLASPGAAPSSLLTDQARSTNYF